MVYTASSVPIRARRTQSISSTVASMARAIARASRAREIAQYACVKQVGTLARVPQGMVRGTSASLVAWGNTAWRELGKRAKTYALHAA